MLERLDHVNLVVENLEEISRFYCRVLGMDVAKRATISGPWIEAITGLTDAVADVIYLDTKTPVGLELISYRQPLGERADRQSRANTPGIRHIAFRVKDIDAVVDRLRETGATLLSEVQQVPAEQVDFAGLRKQIVYFLDPEGNLVELCEFSEAS